MNPTSDCFNSHRNLSSRSMVSNENGRVKPMQFRDLTIDFEDNIVDLSNLCSSRRRLLAPKGSLKKIHPANKRSPVRKSSFCSNLYPTESKTNVIELDAKEASYIFAKSSLEQQFRPRLARQSSLIRKRPTRNCQDDAVACPPAFVVSSSDPPFARMGSFYSLESSPGIARGGAAEPATPLLPPGAYDCTPVEVDSYDFSTVTSSSTESDGNHHLHGDDSSTTRATNVMPTIEIAPGVNAPLRGSQETWQAIQRGYTCNAACFCCTMELVCIANADFVLCPECKVVSPIERNEEERKPAASCGRTGGVGLGVRAD